MEIVVVIIMVLVSLSLMLKLTYLPLFGKLIICLITALFIGVEWTNASTQSKTQIAYWLQTPDLMLDIAVLITVDVAMQITFCILNAKSIAGDKLSKSECIIRVCTMWLPGILIYPTMFALLVEVIFSFPGIDFRTIGWALAAIVFLVMVLMPSIIKWIIPEKDLRLELIFMLNTIIALLGVIVTVNGRTAVTYDGAVEWLPLIAFVALLAGGLLLGIVLFNYTNNKKISKIK